MSPTGARNRFVRGGTAGGLVGGAGPTTVPGIAANSALNNASPKANTAAVNTSTVSLPSPDWRASKLRIFSVLKHWVKKYPGNFLSTSFTCLFADCKVHAGGWVTNRGLHN